MSTQGIDRQAIMSRALRHGFTLRQQPGGEMDLNEYVYAFAQEVFEAGRKAERAAPDHIQCETCGGTGEIDESIGGESFSNRHATCQDCDGSGEIESIHDFRAGQWWVKALDGILGSTSPDVTPDQKRAVAVVHNLLRHVANLGRVTVTTDESGRAVAVTRQDDEHRILSVIWEAPVTTPVRLADENFFDAIEASGIPIEDVDRACAIKDLVQDYVLRTNGFADEKTDCARSGHAKQQDAEESAAPTYSYSSDGEGFIGHYSSPEEAAADHLNDNPDDEAVDVGQNEQRTAHNYVSQYHIESLLEMVAESAYEDCGDCAESWLSALTNDAEQLKELKQVVGDWIQRKEPPGFWRVYSIRRITRAELVASGHLDQPEEAWGCNG